MKLVDFARPLMTIPSLAIHMNKKVNEGMAFNRQKDMLPLVATLEKDHGKEFFDELLAEELGVNTMLHRPEGRTDFLPPSGQLHLGNGLSGGHSGGAEQGA